MLYLACALGMFAMAGISASYALLASSSEWVGAAWFATGWSCGLAMSTLVDGYAKRKD